MSTILKLDKEYDIWLSQSWSTINHGICGHTFELIDYFLILKNFFKVGIFLAENINWEILEKSIKYKYDLNELEIQEIKNNTIFSNKPKILFGKNILFVDGGFVNTQKITLYFDNIFYFACGNKEIKYNDKKNVWILQDDRVYDPVKLNGINYKKRILFDRLKKINSHKNAFLVYATKNCRNLDNYEELLKYSNNILVITNEENKPKPIEGFKFVVPPVDNLFEEFSTYIYTPVTRKWDCSPRFIAECKYYDKNIIYHKIDYWNEDRGLFWRNWDIENNFDSLYLRPDDEIIRILKNIIK